MNDNSLDFHGKPSVSPTQRLAIQRRDLEKPTDYLARLAEFYDLGPNWGELTVREFCEAIILVQQLEASVAGGKR
jgi:hypothetical protein